MFSLKDKVALVTGASQGIGRATALAFASAGAKVAVAARRSQSLTALVTEIEAAGGEALAVPLDVADAAQVKAGFATSSRNSASSTFSSTTPPSRATRSPCA